MGKITCFRPTKCKRILLSCLLLFACAAGFLVPAFGAEADFQTSVNKAYGIIRGVAAPLATVGIAFSAVMMLIGSDKEAEKAMASIKYIGGALIAILLLPAIINFGKTLFGA